jgi:hypothetical protein
VVTRSAEGEQDDAVRSCVDELAAHCWADPHQMVWGKHVIDAFNQQRQLTLEHQVDLLLTLMRMDAPPLARLEHDHVHPERAHIQLAPQRLETLAAVTIKRRERDVRVGHRASIEPPAMRPRRVASPRQGTAREHPHLPTARRRGRQRARRNRSNVWEVWLADHAPSTTRTIATDI